MDEGSKPQKGEETYARSHIYFLICPGFKSRVSDYTVQLVPTVLYCAFIDSSQ